MHKCLTDVIDESEFYEAIREKRFIVTHYYANVCHICRKYGKKVNLKRCSNCKMIAYCSREHQKEHWPKHKQFCQTIGKMNKESSGLVLDWKNKMDPNKESWFQFKVNVANRLLLRLGRKLLISEMEMILLPRSCIVCHEIDSQKLIDCPNCPTTTFCTEHADQDHKKRCDNSRLCFEVESEPSAGLYFLPFTNIDEKIPKNMEDVTRLYKTTYNIDETKLSLKLGMIQFSDVLTRPYTLFYVMEILSFSRKHINLHVVGADKIEETTVHHWEDLLHHIEPSKHLEITLIGPKLETQRSLNITPCTRCKENKATILIKAIGKMYHDYTNSKEFTKPDIIAGFNLGMHEVSETRGTWPLTIKEIEKQGCPFLMTSYKLREQKDDEKMINNTLGRNVKFVYSEKNPFSCLMPNRDFETEDFIFPNDYLTVYKRL